MEPYELFLQPSGVVYKTNQSKQELYSLLRERLSGVLSDRNDLANRHIPSHHRKVLNQLEGLKGGPTKWLPQVTFLTVQDKDTTKHYTELRNNTHSNITSLLFEEDNRTPENDTITVTNQWLSWGLS